MIRISALFLLLSGYAYAQLFPDSGYGILRSVIASRPAGFQLYDRNLYGRKNACDALTEVADRQMQWARSSTIPADLKRKYLDTLRRVKQDARKAKREQDVMQCRRYLDLYMSPMGPGGGMRPGGMFRPGPPRPFRGPPFMG